MLTVILISSVVLLIIGKNRYDDLGEMIYYISLSIATPAFLILLIILLCYPFEVNKTLEMYQQENILIEEKVKNTVQGYMNYEQDTYKNLVQTAELEMLLIKYPELNSNELVKSEIEIYKENSKKIKELKEQKIHKNILNWWLYFNIGNK